MPRVTCRGRYVHGCVLCRRVRLGSTARATPSPAPRARLASTCARLPSRRRWMLTTVCSDVMRCDGVPATSRNRDRASVSRAALASTKTTRVNRTSHKCSRCCVSSCVSTAVRGGVSGTARTATRATSRTRPRRGCVPPALWAKSAWTMARISVRRARLVAFLPLHVTSARPAARGRTFLHKCCAGRIAG